MSYTSENPVLWEHGVAFRETKDDFFSHTLSDFHTFLLDPDTSLTLGMRILFEPGNTESWRKPSDRDQLSILVPLLEEESSVNKYDKVCGIQVYDLRL